MVETKQSIAKLPPFKFNPPLVNQQKVEQSIGLWNMCFTDFFQFIVL
jgi:hypothetical protein